MENIQVCGQNLLMLLNNVLDLARIENDKTEMEYSVSDIKKISVIALPCSGIRQTARGRRLR